MALTQDYQVWPGNQLDLSKVNQKDMPEYLQLLTDTRTDASYLENIFYSKSTMLYKLQNTS